jgi:hypothetical protein
MVLDKAPIVHPKINTGKEFPSVPPFGKRQVAHVEFGMRMVAAGVSRLKLLP